MAGFANPALAQGRSGVEVDIRAQDLALALIQFARQAGVEIAFTQTAVKTKKAPRVQGRFEAAEALDMLLADTGLTARETAEGVFLIEDRRREAAPATDIADHGPQPYDVMEEISVSGTRIQRSGMTTPTPVTSMTTQELRQLSPTTLMDALSQLPQFSGNQTPATVNTWTGNSGGAILNLRGIGGNRTLTLLNGRRIVSSTRIGTTDVNIFPEAVMQRVEVVTGGASAAYGSDAVAGVVNFILDTDFEGVKGSVQGGISERGDGDNYKLSLATGTQIGENMHVLLAGDYFHSAAVKNYDDRNWFDSWGVINNPDPNGPDRIHARNLHSRAYTAGGLVTTGPFAGTQFLDDGTPAPFFDGDIVSSAGQSGGSGYDMSSRYWPTTENTRGSLFGYVSYDIDADWTVYAQGLYGHSNSTTDKGPNMMYGSWGGKLFVDNAYLPAALRQQMVDAGVESVSFNRAGSRDLGGARASMDNDTYSITTGFEGEVSGWRVNGYYQYGINKQRIDLTNVVRLDRIYRSLDAVQDPMGRIVCRSTLTHPDDGCVPTSFLGDGAVTAEARDYIQDDERAIQDVDQHFAEVTVDGELFEGWAGPVSLAVGASYRRDGFDQVGDPAGIGSGDAGCLTGAEAVQAGYKGLAAAYQGCTGRFERGSVAEVSGSFNVKEVFAETLVPLVDGAPFAQSVNLSLAARYAD
jgi:outer membrane receptor protein involved in Fe transport